MTAIDEVGNETASAVFSFTTEPTPIDFVTIPSGQFEMGSPTDTNRTAIRRGTQHTVTLTGSYWMQSTEVTNAQYAELAQWALDQIHHWFTRRRAACAMHWGFDWEELLDLQRQ